MTYIRQAKASASKKKCVFLAKFKYTGHGYDCSVWLWKIVYTNQSSFALRRYTQTYILYEKHAFFCSQTLSPEMHTFFLSVVIAVQHTFLYCYEDEKNLRFSTCHQRVLFFLLICGCIVYISLCFYFYVVFFLIHPAFVLFSIVLLLLSLFFFKICVYIFLFFVYLIQFLLWLLFSFSNN